MTHTDLITRLRVNTNPDNYDPRSLLCKYEIERIEAAHALTAAQERIEMAECAGFSAGYEAGQKDVESLLDAAYAAGQERMREAAIERCVNILTETGITGGIPDDPLTGLVRDDILTLPITPRPDRGDRA